MVYYNNRAFCQIVHGALRETDIALVCLVKRSERVGDEQRKRLPHFDSLTDPRRDNANKLHRLGDIVFLVFEGGYKCGGHRDYLVGREGGI